MLHEARITSDHGGPCEIMLPPGKFRLDGKSVSGRLSVETKPGHSIVITA
jgi:hypothetical protein